MSDTRTEEDLRTGKEWILQGRTALGIEFGSTRIKAVLIGEDYCILADGSHAWENSLRGGLWTYSLEDIWCGLHDCYAALAGEVLAKYGVVLKTVGSIGISGMMHGYMAFDSQGNLLVPFRTWRNTTTARAAEELTALFGYPIPQRWSVAHLYQAVLNDEPHLERLAYLTTLAGYVHFKLTGERLVGVGEASGMFPVDGEGRGYDREMLRRFTALMQEKYRGKYPWNIEDILPRVRTAGEAGGVLSPEGAKLLDVSGNLEAGIPLCPPEGDAGTGMVATCSVARRTGNISAGTSVFAMVVLEKPLSRVYREIDLVTTPAGAPVAMVHCNNCTSDLNAWAGLFGECLEVFGRKTEAEELYTVLYRKALEGAPDCGGLLSYNYVSGEPVTGFSEGRPLFVRKPDAALHLADFMRLQLCSALAALKTGMDILRKEQVGIDRLLGHGGFYKTPEAGQRVTAAALNCPVTVMETAGEGGAWGMAVLAAYGRKREEGETLEAFLDKKVFAEAAGTTITPEAAEVKGFETFMEHYRRGLDIERAAVEAF